MAENDKNTHVEIVDRSMWIKIFGVLNIIIGVFAVLMAFLTFIGMLVGSMLQSGFTGSMRIYAIVSPVLMYLAVSVILIWCGIGVFKRRRWAGALMLVISSIWLIIGVIAMCSVLVTTPKMLQKIAEARGIDPGIQTVTLAFTIGFTAIIYLIIPGILVLFYSRPAVRGTFNLYSPSPSWTDKCPLPVLGLSLFFFIGIYGCICGVFMGVFPVFGVILKGFPAVLLWIGCGALLIYISRGLYKLNIKAWWIALIWHISWLVSSLITFSKVSMENFYIQMGVTGDQMEIIKMAFITWKPFIWLAIFSVFILIVYQLYILRFFNRPGINTT